MNQPLRWIALTVVMLLVVAACGGDDAGTDDEATTTTAAPATTAADTTETTEAMAEDTTTTAGAEGPAGDLSRCPNPIVMQTDWFPEPEHGALYNLTAGEGSVDPESGVFTGPLAADPSITVEIRAGGPYIGSQPTVSLLYSDDSIFLGYVNTDEQIATFEDTPTIAVMAPLEKNPQILMWDPETYDFESFSDIGESGAIVNVFAGQFYTEYLVGTGQLDAAQIDPSYDGGPQRFIAENGALVQQGFATQEPYNYENSFEDWGKPVDFLLIHDSGYEIYQGALGIRPDKLDDAARACLTAFIPLVQQSAVDFQVDPSATNAAILQAVIDLDSFWVLSEESVANTVMMMDSLGIVANGNNDTLGDFDLDRIDTIIEQVSGIPAFNVPDGLSAGDLVTNEFIDPSIGR
jgi:hypothetical protein